MSFMAMKTARRIPAHAPEIGSDMTIQWLDLVVIAKH
jgi:hypothetical protein